MLKKVEGNIVDIFTNTIYFGEVNLMADKIFSIKKIDETRHNAPFICPGFVDAHIHIESSLLVPSQFACLAVKHGTIATVSDPHEIANVVGEEGIEYMINDAKQVPLKFYFGVPSCVPATKFETAGSVIDEEACARLLQKNEIKYLAEMMNFPGVISEDPMVMAKIEAAKALNKPIDGHAPGLKGEDATQYFSKGISTDHECFSRIEAEEKLGLGVKILIREGSAARNFDELIPLAMQHSHRMMFCSDDKHPDELIESHINQLVKRAVLYGVDVFDAIRMASLNPVRHYNLEMGLLREGENADFMMVDNLKDFNVQAVYINGEEVYDGIEVNFEPTKAAAINQFKAEKIYLEDIKIERPDKAHFMNVIKVIEGQLITEKKTIEIKSYELSFDEWLSQNGIQKLVVYNRYQESLPAVAFVEGFALSEGALASTIAHDSHNVIAVGCRDQDIVDVINKLVECKGGLCAASKNRIGVLALPVAGLMSNEPALDVAHDYIQIDKFVKESLGCPLKAPFMTLSFLALLVIPSLKLSDKGLFDGDSFSFSSIFG